MALILIRHASAGDRSRWAGDDLERPLDDRGRAEAERIRVALAGRTIQRVLSSRAVRCSQTVAPVAHAHGLAVELVDELTEGAPVSTTVAQLAELASGASDDGDDGDVVLCSHGDVIPPVLSHLVRNGMVVHGRRGCEKGSLWELEVRGRHIVSATYRAPDALSVPDRAAS